MAEEQSQAWPALMARSSFERHSCLGKKDQRAAARSGETQKKITDDTHPKGRKAGHGAAHHRSKPAGFDGAQTHWMTCKKIENAKQGPDNLLPPNRLYINVGIAP